MVTINSLNSVRWETAFNTFGNDHSTLIGLLVDWWVSTSESHWALEGGASTPSNKRGGRGWVLCDALFCREKIPIGVLEVEGTKHEEKLRNLGLYFSSPYLEFSSIQFGLLLGYRTEARGRGNARNVESLPSQDWIHLAKKVTVKHPDRQIILVGLEKSWRRESNGIRKRNGYYQCHPREVWAASVKNGQASRVRILIRKDI